MTSPLPPTQNIEHGADESQDATEPRSLAAISILVVSGIYTALPDYLMVGPRWLFLVISLGLLASTIITYRRGHHRLNSLLGYILEGMLTLFMVWSLVLLIRALPSHREAPVMLLRSASALWVTNVLVFALWYWRLDAGGPHQRDQAPGHQSGSFLFPQMMFQGNELASDWKLWSPNFIDYLFLAFNTSTAFSPTDVAVLSRWAKLLTMAQASISLIIVVILAARAVNIL
jgi:hypothetical protein